MRVRFSLFLLCTAGQMVRFLAANQKYRVRFSGCAPSLQGDSLMAKLGSPKPRIKVRFLVTLPKQDSMEWIGNSTDRVTPS